MAKKSLSKCDAGTPAGTRPERPPATSLEQLLAFPLDVCEAAADDIRPFQLTVLTGFLDLHELTEGFAESELVVVAGRPGAGASGFALKLVWKVAVEDRKSIFIVSLEQRRTDLAGRFLCCQGRLDLQKLYQGRTAGDDLQRVKEAAAAL